MGLGIYNIFQHTVQTWSSDIVRSGVSFLERKNDFTNFLMMYRFKEKTLGILAFGEFLKPSWNIRNICKIAIEFFINQFAIFRLYSINQQLSKFGLLVGLLMTILIVSHDCLFFMSFLYRYIKSLNNQGTFWQTSWSVTLDQPYSEIWNLNVSYFSSLNVSTSFLELDNNGL